MARAANNSNVPPRPLSDAGRRDCATEPQVESLDIRRRVLGDEHLETLLSINNKGGLLHDLGRLDEAERLGAEAVETAKRILGTGHWHTAVFLGLHDRTLITMERYAEAAEQLLEAAAIFETALHPKHDRTIGTIRHLADLYERWHKMDSDAGHNTNATEWRAKLEYKQAFA